MNSFRIGGSRWNTTKTRKETAQPSPSINRRRLASTATLALDSTFLLTDSSGSVVGTGSYSPWGVPDNGSVTLNDFGFAGSLFWSAAGDDQPNCRSTPSRSQVAHCSTTLPSQPRRWIGTSCQLVRRPVGGLDRRRRSSSRYRKRSTSHFVVPKSPPCDLGFGNHRERSLGHWRNGRRAR